MGYSVPLCPRKLPLYLPQVVAVETYTVHPRYKKRSRVFKKYKVHDEDEACKVGDLVSISPCKPISKSKTFVLAAVEKSSS